MGQPQVRLQVERSSSLATLQWHRPEVANAFDGQLTRDLTDALADLDEDPAIEVCVLQGRGRHFSSGWDLNDLERLSADTPADEAGSYFDAGTALLEQMSAMRPLLVARARGTTAGFGVAVAGRCDVVIAHPDSSFGCPEITTGIVPRLVAADLVGRLDERTALTWLTTGRMMAAPTAQAAGLVNLILDDGEFDQQMEAWQRLTVRHPGCVAATKDVARELAELPPEQRRSAAIETTVRDLITARGRP